MERHDKFVIMTWKCFVYLKHAHCVQCVVLLLPIILDVKEKEMIGKRIWHALKRDHGWEKLQNM